MAESVDSYVRQLLDNTQYLAAKEKEIKEEERLKAIRAAGGKEGVRAYQSIQRAEEQRTKAAEQQEKYLRDLRLRYNAEQEKAAKKAAADMESGALGFSGSDIDAFAAKGASAAAGVAAIGAAATGAVLALNSGAEAILAIDDASRRLTIGRDTILALAQAGEQTGVAFSQIEGLLENLPERITQAAQGGNEYAESFERLGVAVKDANGKTRDADSVLRDLLGSLAGLESQTVKAGLAQNLLSDVGLALVQTGALDSKAALDQYLASVEGSALITDEAVRQARNWRGALSDVGKQAKSVKVEIFNAFGDDAAQIIDNVSLALEFLRTVGFEKLQNKVEEAVGTLTFFWDAVTGDISFKEADARLKALRVELKAEEDAAWDGVQAFYEQRKARREATVAAGEAGEATTKLAKTTKDAAEADREAAEAARERERVQAMLLKTLLAEANAEIKRVASLDEAKASLEEMRRASEEALATDRERIQLAAQAAREEAVAAANAAQALSDSSEERKRIAQDLAATLININVEEARQFKAIEDEKTKEAKEQAEKRAKAAVDTATTALDAAAEASAEIATAIGAQNAKAGEEAWKISQQIATLQATASALEAGAKAAAGAAALGPVAAAAAGIATFALVEGAYVAKLSALETPTFTDTPPGGYRFTGESNTIQGATNDTAILFRDPLEGFQQALDVLSRRQAPTSTPARDRRPLLGKQLATTPVARLLTRDAERLTRGRI